MGAELEGARVGCVSKGRRWGKGEVETWVSRGGRCWATAKSMGSGL